MSSLQGHLLLASPQLQDPNFIKTVILIVQHSDEGALGLVLNRPTETSIREAWEQVSEKPCLAPGVLFHGGPCEGPLMVVHTHEDQAQVRVRPGVCFSTESGHVEWLMAHEVRKLRCFVGYAGWGPGQLEAEMKIGSWLTLPAAPEHVFGDQEDQWTGLMQALSDAAAGITIPPHLVPKDPSMN